MHAPVSRPAACGGYLRRLAAFRKEGWPALLLMRMLEQDRQDGITLYFTRDDPETGTAPETVRGALSLIREVDPARYRRMRGLVPRVIVHPTAHTAYAPLARAAMVRAGDTRPGQHALAALLLIRLSTWSRVLGRFGARLPLRSYRRVRIRALHSGLAFVRRLAGRGHPGAPALEAYLRGQLEAEREAANAAPSP